MTKKQIIEYAKQAFENSEGWTVTAITEWVCDGENLTDVDKVVVEMTLQDWLYETKVPGRSALHPHSHGRQPYFSSRAAEQRLRVYPEAH